MVVLTATNLATSPAIATPHAEKTATPALGVVVADLHYHAVGLRSVRATEMATHSRRSTGEELGFPFERGGITTSGNSASDTLILCQTGRSTAMLSFDIQFPGFEREFRVVIDCGASENYARHLSIAEHDTLYRQSRSKTSHLDTIRVKMADALVVSTSKHLVTLPIHIGAFHGYETFYVIDVD